jgi:hypothetical protein
MPQRGEQPLMKPIAQRLNEAKHSYGASDSQARSLASASSGVALPGA